MEQNERIAVIREKFPGYTKPLDSMCKRPEYYGIRRTAEAEALIADKPGRKREAYCNIEAVAFVKQLVRFRFSPNAQGIQIFFGIEILHSMLRGKGQHFFLLSLLYPG